MSVNAMKKVLNSQFLCIQFAKNLNKTLKNRRSVLSGINSVRKITFIFKSCKNVKLIFRLKTIKSIVIDIKRSLKSSNKYHLCILLDMRVGCTCGHDCTIGSSSELTSSIHWLYVVI